MTHRYSGSTLSPACQQWHTTVIGGNCGLTFARQAADRDFITRLFARPALAAGRRRAR